MGVSALLPSVGQVCGGLGSIDGVERRRRGIIFFLDHISKVDMVRIDQRSAEKMGIDPG